MVRPIQRKEGIPHEHKLLGHHIILMVIKGPAGQLDGFLIRFNALLRIQRIE